MPLNIKNPEVERLAAEVAALTGETKTRAVLVALEERRDRLARGRLRRDRATRLRRFLEHEIWPQVPVQVRGRPLSPEERDAILGYGPTGV